MATILCTAVGYDAQSKDGYWAYGAVEYCVKMLKCLPDFGMITNSYKSDILEAYHLGLTVGIDAHKSFDPRVFCVPAGNL